MPSRTVGLWVVGLGLFLVVVGVLIWSGGLGWFGRLPGDIRIERPTLRVYIPIVSMLLASIVITVVLNLLRRFF